MKPKNMGLMYLPPALVVVGFFATIPWLKDLDDTVVGLVTAATALSVMAWGIVVSLRLGRNADEVQEAAQGFAMRYGWTFGTFAFALLLMLPPFRGFATALVITHGNPGPGTTVDRSVVTLAMMLGFAGATVLQAAGTIVMGALWWNAKR